MSIGAFGRRTRGVSKTVKAVKPYQDDVAVENVMKATGLSEKETRELLLMDDDALDGMVDAALSAVHEPNQKVVPTEV